MINKEEAKVDALVAIADLMGKEYFLNHYEGSCECYPTDDFDDIDYEFFLGFEGDDATNKWTVFARVSVNRETREVTFLDYKTPDGKRMQNPLKPHSSCITFIRLLYAPTQVVPALLKLFITLPASP